MGVFFFGLQRCCSIGNIIGCDGIAAYGTYLKLNYMLFLAESRLVFHVAVGGVSKVVDFSEGGEGMPSIYRTDDEAVIAAIRSHRYYRQGKIMEREDAVTASQQSGQGDDDVLDFTSYTQLKAYLKKTFKDDARVTKIKTPEQVKEYAREKGVNWRMV